MGLCLPGYNAPLLVEVLFHLALRVLAERQVHSGGLALAVSQLIIQFFLVATDPHSLRQKVDSQGGRACLIILFSLALVRFFFS